MLHVTSEEVRLAQCTALKVPTFQQHPEAGLIYHLSKKHVTAPVKNVRASEKVPEFSFGASALRRKCKYGEL